jgi:hypothetical protein
MDLDPEPIIEGSRCPAAVRRRKSSRKIAELRRSSAHLRKDGRKHVTIQIRLHVLAREIVRHNTQSRIQDPFLESQAGTGSHSGTSETASVHGPFLLLEYRSKPARPFGNIPVLSGRAGKAHYSGETLRHCLCPVAVAVLPAEPAAQLRQTFKHIARCFMFRTDARFSASHCREMWTGSREIGANSDDDDPVSRLGDAEFLRTDDKGSLISRRCDIDAAASSRRQGEEPVPPPSAAGTAQISQHPIEDLLSVDGRGGHPLDILHDKDRGTELTNNPDIFSIQKVPAVVAGLIPFHSEIPGSADSRIRLAGRSSDQDGVA